MTPMDINACIDIVGLVLLSWWGSGPHGPSCPHDQGALARAIVPAAIEAGLDPLLLGVTCLVESGGWTRAISARGAVGVCQVMPMEGRPPRASLFQPHANARAAAGILRRALARCRGLGEALSVYAGIGRCRDSAYARRVLGGLAAARSLVLGGALLAACSSAPGEKGGNSGGSVGGFGQGGSSSFAGMGGLVGGLGQVMGGNGGNVGGTIGTGGETMGGSGGTTGGSGGTIEGAGGTVGSGGMVGVGGGTAFPWGSCDFQLRSLDDACPADNRNTCSWICAPGATRGTARCLTKAEGLAQPVGPCGFVSWPDGPPDNPVDPVPEFFQCPSNYACGDAGGVPVKGTLMGKRVESTMMCLHVCADQDMCPGGLTCSRALLPCGGSAPDVQPGAPWGACPNPAGL